MSLPQLSHPTFTLNLPSTGAEIVYRPFLVKEEKILLIAQQGRVIKDIVRAIKQVVKNCIVSESDVEQFTTFDLEYFFLQLRAKSVNNIVKLEYRDREDNEVYKFEVDLEAIPVQKDPDHTNVIKVDDTMQLIMKYPQLDLMDLLPKHGANAVEFTFDLLYNCLDKLIVTSDDEQVFLFSEETKADVEKFVAQLSVPTFKQIQKFFDTMPKLHHVLEYTNKKGTQQRIELRKLDDFFTLG